jgi:hypothetical protein
VVSFTTLPLYITGKEPRIHLTAGWLGNRTGVDDVEKGNFLLYRDLNFTSSVVQLSIHY